MAKKQLPPLTEDDVRFLIHQIVKRMILVGLGAVFLGVAIIAALALWYNG